MKSINQLKFSATFFSLFCVFFTYAQSLNWNWTVKPTSATGTNSGSALTCNASGNIYVAGRYSNGLVIGTSTLSGNATYIASYDANGNVLSSIKASSGAFITQPTKIALDANNNIFVAGTYYGNLVIGTQTLTGFGNDAYLAKYNNSGLPLWAVNITGSGTEWVNGLTIDASNNVIIGGTFNSTVATVGTQTLSNTSGNNITNSYLAKFDTNGNLIWAYRPSGISDGKAVDTDPSGNVYFSGTFNSTLTVGTNTLVRQGVTNDIFISKFDVSGNNIWAVRVGGDGPEENYDLIHDGNGHVFITGEYNGSGTNGFACGTTTVNSGLADVYLAKYDDSGNGQWIKSSGGANYDYGKSICADQAGNVYVSGYFESPLFTAGSYTVANTGGGGAGGFNDLLVIKYDSNGNELGILNAIGAHSDYASSITSDINGNVYVTGYSQSTSLAFGTTTLTLPGYDYSYLSKINSATNAGIHELALARIIISPNPCADMVTISSDKLFHKDDIIILDIIGKQLVNETIIVTQLSDSQIKMDFASLSAGIYFIKHKSGLFYTQKVIVQH